MKNNLSLHLFIGAAVSAVACGTPARLPVAAGTGVRPVLPTPEHALIPIVNVVTAKPWRAEAAPTAADGLTVRAFARGLDHPRWLYVLPNGDVLVAETNAPRRPEDGKGIKGFFFEFFQAKAGGAVPSPNRIILLRDTDGDGVADSRSVLLANLHSPFGMTLVGNSLYVANTDALMRFPYTRGATQITAAGTRVTGLPGGRINHHWTKNVIARPTDRSCTSLSAQQQCGRERIGREEGRAAIGKIDPRQAVIASSPRVCEIGRAAWEPNASSVAVNERDELGSDLVPDYITSVRSGGFYGWPYSYYGKHLDLRVEPERPDLVEKAIVPDFALGPHTASLGLAWSGSASLPARFSNGMFVGQHGSWNRKPRSGYKVIFVPFARGMPAGQPIDVLTGFVKEMGTPWGARLGSLSTDPAPLLWRTMSECRLRVSRAGSR